MPTYLNDRNIDDIIDTVLALDGHIAPTITERAVLPIANAPGVFGNGVTVRERLVSIILDVRSTAPVDRAATIDNLARRLKGLLLLRTDDQPDREVYCTCSNIEVALYSGAYALGTVSVTITLRAIDPTRYEREARIYALTTARTVLPVGTVPSAPVVYVYGANPSVTDPQLILRNASGDEIQRLTLTGTLATNDALVVDCARQTIALYVAGVLQTGINSGNAWLTSGTFPVLDPEDTLDGDLLTLELDAASGTPTGLALYRRGF
jgi:phage-related protein